MQNTINSNQYDALIGLVEIIKLGNTERYADQAEKLDSLKVSFYVQNLTGIYAADKLYHSVYLETYLTGKNILVNRNN